jgi:hypothetical protein
MCCLSARIDAQGDALGTRIDSFAAAMHTGFDRVDERFDRLERRFDAHIGDTG